MGKVALPTLKTIAKGEVPAGDFARRFIRPGVLGDADLGFVVLSRGRGSDPVAPALALAAGLASPGPCLNLHLAPNLNLPVFAKIMQSSVATAVDADLSGV